MPTVCIASAGELIGTGADLAKKQDISFACTCAAGTEMKNLEQNKTVACSGNRACSFVEQ
ncbi:hypothetical protein HMPREF1981_02634 [Bacteroides pyogenes F0041]|uniref:Uncharacterized protein n=1 Tax=Bacteroides pyogenes F0041 TaxID=1321819 RepID=U2DQX8_9BACE|nr:hypothetical protein HMPREF1981_02634 [Bacteroides pyogenes F0041]GAE23213.1 hypothetical protein JCM10003_2936 [Bacteroides pyogenes JCM 10003]